MNNTIKEQLQMLKTLEFQIDGKPSRDFPEFFSEVIFFKNTNTVLVDTLEKQFIFADYIVTPYEGFDFHNKFNKGIAPPEKVMFGVILRESEKMIYIKVRSHTTNKIWEGWCPRKSVTIS